MLDNNKRIKMNCKEVKNNFPHFLSGDLDENTTRDFEQHISQCKLCREELENLRQLDIIIAQAKTPEQNEQFWDSYPEEVMEKINMLPQEKEKRIRRKFEFPFFIRKPAYAFAFAAVLIIGFISYQEWFSVDDPVTVSYSNSLEFFIEEYDAVDAENVLSKDLPFEEDILFYNDIN